jgi:hypothetical protein
MNLNIKDPALRRYIYGVVAAVIPLLLLVGLITPDAVAPILNAAAALLGLGTAALALPNTPRSDPAAVEVDEAFVPEDGTGRYRAETGE